MMKKLFRNAKEHSGALFMSACVIILAIGTNSANWANTVGIMFVAICLTMFIYVLDLCEQIERGDMYIWLMTAWLATGIMIGKCLP